jgi:hypothetical protein
MKWRKTLDDGEPSGFVSVLLDEDGSDPLLHLGFAVSAKQVLGLAWVPQPEECYLGSRAQHISIKYFFRECSVYVRCVLRRCSV